MPLDSSSPSEESDTSGGVRRVLILSDCIAGGVGRHTGGLARYLTAIGTDVKVVVLPDGSPYEARWLHAVPGVEVSRFDGFARSSAAANVLSLLRHFRPEAVFSAKGDPTGGSLRADLASRALSRLALLQHGTPPPAALPRLRVLPPRLGLHRRLPQIAARYAPAWSGLTWCPSETAATRLASLWGMRRAGLTVIPLGVDTKVFRPIRHAHSQVRPALGIDEGDFVVGMVARPDVHGKGLDLACRAANTIAQRLQSRVHLLIVGVGSAADASELPDLVAGLGGSVVVHFAGIQESDERMVSLYHAMDVFLLASRHETGPLSVLEAMACGLPVVSTPVGDAPAIVASEYGVVTRSIDADQLADGLMTVQRWSEAQRQTAADAAFEAVRANRSDVDHYRRLLAAVIR